MTPPVWCHDCREVHSATREEQRPWRYRCMKHPTKPGYGFVHPRYSPDPPYQLCDRVNFDGRCPDFSPLRAAVEEPAS